MLKSHLFYVLLFLTVTLNATHAATPTTATLLDWSDWGRYRDTVSHPALKIKPADIDRARENIQRHQWARDYAEGIEERVSQYADQITSEFLVTMIPETTPLGTLFTPCPACRDQDKPYQPHGTWRWTPEKSEELHCTVCHTVFPNEKYPETVELKSTRGKPQVFTYYGGDTFELFSWRHGRPSFTGNIRAQKVVFMTRLANDFSVAYALSGNPAYAAACRDILHRFSQVYPHYLVHSGYGEFADMDPREAGLTMMNLSKPELTYPPNKPNNRLFVDFWMVGRATGTGLEGTVVRMWAESYTLTREAADSNGAPIYTDAVRRQIEQDLLLESTILLVTDPQLNNKSIANRAAVGMVGASLGLPEMVRFGLSGFHEMVNDWFLPDGATPESISYGFMATAGIRDVTLAFRDYSDPPGYTDAEGQRYDKLNLFRDSNYQAIWDAFLDCMLPDLTFPAFADAHVNRPFNATDAEIIAAVYPENQRYTSLLAALSPKGEKPSDAATALFLRKPDFHETTHPELTYPDHCRPHYKIGYMRTGEAGRESLLVLSASPWGIHRHQDSLNLYYWKNGHELLTDLGYLWDHADSDMTYRTFAHNLVMIDEANQATKTRGGELECVHNSDRVKVMRGSSDAYATASLYRRTAVLIDHGNGHSYAVDLFEVDGGRVQDYVFHGPAHLDSIDGIELSETGNPLYDLTDVRAGKTTGTWSLSWDLADDMRFTTWNVPQSGEQAYIGTGWGQRFFNNSDRGTTIPYIIRRTTGDGQQQFVTVFEGNPPGQHFIKNVQRLENAGGGPILEITTATGTDYIAWNITEPTSLGDDILLQPGRVSVTSVRNGKVEWNFANASPGTAE